jgi:hypothetical protein
VVGFPPANDGLGKGLPLGAQLPVCQLGQRPRVGLAAAQARENLPRREAAHLGDDGSELAVGVLEDGLQPIGQPCSFVDQVDAITGQVAQVALSG